MIGTSIEHLALQVRHFQRTEVLEAEEYFSAGAERQFGHAPQTQPGPFRKPVRLARLLRGYALTGLENVPLWHERDISHSSALERVIGPDATVFLDFMINRMAGIIEKLIVYPEQMEKNLWLTRGLVFSEGVMLKLMEKGLARGMPMPWSSATP